VDRVVEAGLEPRRFVQDLLERFRDLLVLDAVPDAADTGLIDAPADQLDRMHHQAERYGRPSLSRAADVLATALVDMRGTTSPRLVLELACARILLPGAASDAAALLARLDRLERRLSATGVVDTPPAGPAAAEPATSERPTVEPAAPTSPASPDPVPEPSPAAEATPEPAPRPTASPAAPVAATVEAPTAAAPPGTLDVAALRRLWDSVLDAVKQRSRTAHALMLSSQIESLDDRTLTLSFKTPTLASRFANDVADFVTEALREVVGIDLKLRAVSATSAAPAAGQTRVKAGGAAPAGSSQPEAERVPDPNPEPDEIDITGADGPAVQDPSDAALSLVKESLGGQVIGEIDQS
jgi:DNA polymerase-3 subunit gamma/tau